MLYGEDVPKVNESLRLCIREGDEFSVHRRLKVVVTSNNVEVKYYMTFKIRFRG